MLKKIQKAATPTIFIQFVPKPINQRRNTGYYFSGDLINFKVYMYGTVTISHLSNVAISHSSSLKASESLVQYLRRFFCSETINQYHELEEFNLGVSLTF